MHSSEHLVIIIQCFWDKVFHKYKVENQNQNEGQACDNNHTYKPSLDHSGCKVKPKSHKFLLIDAKDDETLVEFHDILSGDCGNIVKEEGVLTDEIVFEADSSFGQLHILYILAPVDIIGIGECASDVLTNWWIELISIADLIDLCGKCFVEDIFSICTKILEINNFVKLWKFVILVCDY